MVESYLKNKINKRANKEIRRYIKYVSQYEQSQQKQQYRAATNHLWHCVALTCGRPGPFIPNFNFIPLADTVADPVQSFAIQLKTIVYGYIFQVTCTTTPPLLKAARQPDAVALKAARRER